MSMEETWYWLGTVVEYLMAVFGILAALFFLLAIISRNHSRRYGFLSGGSAIGMFLCLVLGTTGNAMWGVPAKAFMGTFQFALSSVFIICAIFLVYFAYDAKNNVKYKEAFYSTFMMAVIMFVLGIFMLIPSLKLFFGSQEISTIENLIPYYTLTFPFPIARIVLVIVILTIFAVGAYTLKEMKSKKYLTDISQNQDKFQRTYSKLDLEISRKLYHVVIVVVLILYLFVAYMILDTIYHFTLFNLPQPPEMPPPQEIIDQIVKPYILDFRAGHILLLIAVSWIFIILFFTDVVRIKKYRYYPIKMIAKIYRDKEQLVLAPHIYLTVGALFAIMLSDAIASFLGTPTISAHIVMITIMISALADAIATIIGITKGNHLLKEGKSKKTWEGWIAGFISAIIFGLLSYIILIPKYGGNMVQAVVLSLVAAAVFSIIDFFSPPIPISDNLLNPVAISLSLWGVSLLFFI